MTGPLRELLKINIIWNWNWSHEKAFSNVKQLIVKVMVLKTYDPKFPLEIQYDASQKAISYYLMQHKKPLSYALCALMETEKSWAQIKKEFLKITEAYKKFHNLH